MLKVGVVGVGGISGAHIPLWEAMKDTELVALCDIRAEQMERYPDKRHYTDIDEMLRQEELDILDICLPTHLHVDTAVKAMEKGIHVICEKPISTDPAQVQRAYGTAEKMGVKFMIAQVLRFWPQYELVKEIYDTKRYGKLTALDALALRVHRGELFSLLGVNGAGKTTAIKLLTCLSKPTEGDARVGGHSITKEPDRVKALIGVSPQETAVAPNLTVEENLALICGIHGFSKEKTARRIGELSAQFSLENVLKRKAGKLSGGWQRRVSIAMALISQPQILFLDEPTLGLDVLARHELWDIIQKLKGHVTIILTTHYMEEAQALSDRIGILKDGHLLAVGTAAELMDRAGAADFETAFVSIVKEVQA